VGGRYLAVASVEYVHWFLPQWGGAVFMDRGNATDSLEDLKPVAGYGVGARWKSPVGPLNLDIAYGEKTQALRLHFSVGFSF
jgi:translocation and assembly module TamA